MQELISGTRECRLYLYIKTLIATLIYWYKCVIKQLIKMRYLIYCKSLKQKYSIRSLRSRSLRSLRSLRFRGEKHFPIVYINNIYIYYSSKWPIPIFLMTLMTLTLMTAFSRFFGYLQSVFSCFAMFLQ